MFYAITIYWGLAMCYCAEAFIKYLLNPSSQLHMVDTLKNTEIKG